MTANFHTPISSDKRPANAATFNAPLGELDAALTSEVQQRGAADIAEMQARIAADNAEAQARAAADTMLSDRIDDLIIDSGTSDAETIAARGSYDILGDRLNGIDQLPFAMRLGANVSAGATSISVRTIPDLPSRSTYIVIDPYTIEAEVRLITTVAGTTINFSGGAPLAYAHSVDDPVLILHRAEINPRMFGAVADGVTDDSVPLQRALNAASNHFVTVNLGMGTYAYGTTLELTRACVVRGARRGRSVLAYTGAGTALQSTTATANNQVLLEDFNVTTSTGAVGIHITTGMLYSEFNRLSVLGFSDNGIILSAGANGAWWNSINDVIIRNGVDLPDATGTGLLLTGTTDSANANYINRCNFGACAVGLHIERGDGNFIYASDFERNVLGYKETQKNATHPIGNKLYFCRFETNTNSYDFVIPAGYPPTGTVLDQNLFVASSPVSTGNATGNILTRSQFITNSGFEMHIAAEAESYRTGWSTAGSGITQTRAGVGTADEERFAGNYCMKVVTSSPSGAYVYYFLPGYEWFIGRTVTFVAYVKTSTANAVRVQLNDGVSSTNSPFHTGSGTWERLVVTRNISMSATRLQPRINFANGVDCTVYIDNAELFDGVVF